MKAKFFICAVVFSSLFTNIYSQNSKTYTLFTIDNNVSDLKMNEVKDNVDDAVLLKVDRASLEDLYTRKDSKIRLQIPYDGNQIVSADLNRIDILTSDAKIIARTTNGDEEVKLENLVISYIGKLEGMDNTFIAINFTKDKITGMLSSVNDNFVLGQMNESDGINLDNYILYQQSKLKKKNGFICSTEENVSSSAIEEMRAAIKEKMNDNLTNDIRVAKIALDVDYATFLSYQSSTTNAANYALSLLSAVSGLYMKEVNVKLVVPYIRVWTTADPFVGATSNPVLQSFRSVWNSTQQSVERTVAHLVSVRGGNLGGIAYLNVLCSSVSGGNGYGFSNTQGPINALPLYSWDVQVVTHELGHNFGSSHTHSCSWVGGVIDSCYATEGGCYTGPPIPRLGTIMSYCHLVGGTGGGISFVLGFGPQPRALIRSRAENAFCMTTLNSAIAVAYPNGGEILRSGNNVQVYWGASITGNVNIQFSSDNGSSWQTVQNNVPAQQRLIDWTIPYLYSPLSKVRIINSSNPNEGDTSDAAFKVLINLNSFALNSPPTSSRIDVTYNDPTIQKFIWNNAGNDPSVSYTFKIKKLGPGAEYSYISDNNGLDTAISFRKSFLDTLAQTLGPTGDSTRCIWKVKSFNGVDTFYSANTFIVTFVRTSVGINVISTNVPEKFNLENNYPNPFNPSTNIKFEIPKLSFIELTIYDSRGKEVAELVNQKLHPGSYEYSFDAGNLPSGAYFYRLKAAEFTETKRMVLIK